MDEVFGAFKQAWNKGNGYALADIFSPIPPSSNPDRLHNFFRSTNFSQAQKRFEDEVFDVATFSDEEGLGWSEVFFAYWKAVGEILIAEASEKANKQVRSFSPYLTTSEFFHIFICTLKTILT